MEKRRIRRFLNDHRFLEISSARIVYSLICDGDLIEDALEEGMRHLRRETDAEMERKIRDTDDPRVLVDLMRKPMDWKNQFLLRGKVLETGKDLGGAEWFHKAGFADFCGDRGKPVPLGHGKLSVFPLRICPQHLLHTPGPAWVAGVYSVFNRGSETL